MIRSASFSRISTDLSRLSSSIEHNNNTLIGLTGKQGVLSRAMNVLHSLQTLRAPAPRIHAQICMRAPQQRNIACLGFIKVAQCISNTVQGALEAILNA